MGRALGVVGRCTGIDYGWSDGRHDLRAVSVGRFAKAVVPGACLSVADIWPAQLPLNIRVHQGTNV